MFAVLAREIDGLDIPLDGELLADANRLLDRLTAKVTMANAAYDAAALWDVEGGGVDDVVATGPGRPVQPRRPPDGGDGPPVAGLPVTAQAWADGALSAGQVQAITANLNDKTAPLYAEHEAELVPQLASLDVGDTTVAMQAWAAKAKALLGEDDPTDQPGTADLSPLLDGRGRLDATLDAEGYQIARKALRLAVGKRAVDDTRSPAERSCEGLVGVFRFFLDHQDTASGGHHRPHLNVVIDHDALITGEGQGFFVDTGAPITAADALRLACDSNVHRILTKGRSATLDYGRATRTVSPELFTVVARRDRGCRFPGCDRPVARTEAHHLRHWLRDHGTTDEHNLALFCGHHHRVIHRPHWTVELLPTGHITVTDPNRRARTSDPPTPPDHAHAA